MVSGNCHLQLSTPCNSEAPFLLLLFLYSSIYGFGAIFLGKLENHYSGSKADALTGHNICILTNWDNASRL